MGAVNLAADHSNVVQALVYNLLNVFDAARDVHHTLSTKEKRDFEQNLRSKGYPSSRRIEFVEDDALASDAGIVMDKAAVTRQFEIGYEAVGAEFAVGDVTSHLALQAHIIALQKVLLTTFLYGPTSTRPISHQLANINAASRAAGTSAVDVLAAQLQRQQAARPPTPRSSHSPVGRMRSNSTRSAVESRHASQSIVRYQEPSKVRSSSPVNTTILDWRGRPKPDRTETDTTTMTGLTSYGTKSEAHDLYCLYAIDLQQHRAQELSDTITSDPYPYCPHCKRTLSLSPGKAWEVLKEEDGDERCFQVSNRFVVKCHRDGADGQYTCVLCTRHSDCVSVCGDVKALIKHIWSDHSIAELKNEEDITEVVELKCDRRRDSGHGHSVSNSSRRSASVGPHRHRSTRSKHAFEREAETYEFRSSRRGG